MCKFIAFLNENSGALTAILTLVLATINYFQWRLANNLRKDANRPRVMADIVGINQVVHYKIINYGTTSAVNIKFNIDPKLINRKQVGDSQRIELERWDENTISLLPNGIAYISTKCLWNEIKEETISLTYSYEDIAGHKYSDTYQFRLSNLDLIGDKDHYELEDRQIKKEIVNTLKSIDKTLHKD